MLLNFETTDQFYDWLNAIGDTQLLARLLDRLNRARCGNFGDIAYVGAGVSEMRIHTGPGYRIYFARQAESVYILLAGGNKSSQRNDIAKAKKLWSLIRTTRCLN